MQKNSSQTKKKNTEYPSAFMSVREWGHLYYLPIHYQPFGYLKEKKLQKLFLISPWLQRDLNCSKYYKIKAEKTPHEFQSHFQAHKHKPRVFHKSSKKMPIIECYQLCLIHRWICGLHPRYNLAELTNWRLI